VSEVTYGGQVVDRVVALSRGVRLVAGLLIAFLAAGLPGCGDDDQAAQQQRDDEHHDGEFDQREAALGRSRRWRYGEGHGSHVVNISLIVTF